MAVLLHQVVLPYTTGLPEDVSVNTFWTIGDFGATDQADEAMAAIIDFYNEPNDNEVTVASYLSAYITRDTNGCYVRTYNHDDPKPRPVFAQQNFTLGAASNQASLPFEVSVVASFQGESQAGIRQARRRGRIFLGPLTVTASQAGSGLPPVPHPTLVETLRQSSLRLAGDLNTTTARWVVHSRVSSGNAHVTNGWVDNEFDTQRRRGTEASARSTWTLSV